MDMEEESQPQAQHDPENEIELKQLLGEVQHILSFSARRDNEILKLFGKDAFVSVSETPNSVKKDKAPFFSEGEIKKIAVKNRFRFLPVSSYSGEIPFEAISVIKSYQHRYAGEELEFFMLAPANFFSLKDKLRDPFLFCRTENGYRLLCQWGKDLPSYHTLLNYPLRSFNSLVISSVILGFLIVVTASFYGLGNDPHWLKFILFKIPLLVLSSGFIATLAFCYGLVNYVDFSEDCWKSDEI